MDTPQLPAFYPQASRFPFDDHDHDHGHGITQGYSESDGDELHIRPISLRSKSTIVDIDAQHLRSSSSYTMNGRISNAMLSRLQLGHDYRSDRSNMVEEFYVPCLSESVEYWRAVGYFTSHGLALAGKGLATFVSNGGKMRLVASPLLEPDDIEAIRLGYESREGILSRSAARQFSDAIVESLTEDIRRPLECIAWMIGEGRLDIKLAVPSSGLLGQGQAIYHEKMGVFLDSEEGAVAFNGSPNETIGGLASNFESLEVYVSWDDPHGRVARKKKDFMRLWHNLTPQLTVLEFPEASKRHLLRFRPSKPPTLQHSPNAASGSLGVSNSPDNPPHVQLRPYQIEACEAWFQAKGRGVLAMATGSGKTITSLAAAVRLLKEQERLFVVVSCPFQHLVDQWYGDAGAFGFRPIRAYQTRSSWEASVNGRILDYKLGNRSFVMLITTHATLSSEVMQASLARISGPALLVADEMHHLGAEHGRLALPPVFQYRMGLSATPERWFDEAGTESLRDYFGGTVFEFTLADAIAQGYLTKYYYYPHLVELTIDEIENYEELTRRIARLYNASPESRRWELREALLRQRADILNKAQNKLEKVKELLQCKRNLHHALFYCAPGQIDTVTSLLGNDFGLRVHKFTSEESTQERGRLLEDFAQGRLQALVAMRCLDEGVDVPSTQVAYLLASTSNPREFIQRRGRILRQAPGKRHAVIHDLVALPSLDSIKKGPPDGSFSSFEMERRILRRELSRFREFADNSINGFQATEIIWEYAKYYKLLDF